MPFCYYYNTIVMSLRSYFDLEEGLWRLDLVAYALNLRTWIAEAGELP